MSFLARFRFASLVLVALALGSVSLTACEGPAGGCQSADDCGATETACDTCPPTGDQLCLEGICEERPADAVDVQASFNLDRDIASDVVSLMYVLAARTDASGAFDCGTALDGDSVATGVAAYSSGFKALSGGSFHQDVSLGRTPDVPLAIVVLATDDDAGNGNIVATGCSASFESGEVIDVDP